MLLHFLRILLSAAFLALTAVAQSPGRLTLQPGPASPPAADGTMTALLVIRSVDLAGAPMVDSKTNLTLGAHGFLPPGIVVSEITLDGQDIELVNAGETTVDLDNWTLEAGPGQFDSARNRQRRIVGPASLPPGGVLIWSCRDGASDVFPRLASTRKFAADGFSVVEVRDATGRIVDQVLFGNIENPRARLWSGNPLSRTGPAGQSLHRGGPANRFARLDWTVAASSIGSAASALSLPWMGPRVRIPIQPSAMVLTNGSWSGLVRFNPGASPAWQVSGSLGDGIHWDSPPQRLLPPPALTLELVDGTTRGSEATPGRVATFRVRLPEPVTPSAAVVVELSLSAPGEFAAPQSVTIPASESAALFDVTNLDDTVADGRARVQLTASANGYGPGYQSLVNEDNESGQLRLSLPEIAPEGAGLLARGGAVFLPSPVLHDTQIGLAAEGRLVVPAQVLVPAGAISANFPIWVQEDAQINLPPARDLVSAGTSGWPMATSAIRILDNEFQTVKLELPASLREGIPAEGRIVLNYPPDRDLAVELTCTQPSLGVPTRLTVRAGQSGVSFPLNLPEDQQARFPAIAEICVRTAGLSVCGSLSLIDNDQPPQRLSIVLPSPLYSTEPVLLRLQLIDAAGQALPRSGPVTLRVIPSPGNAELTPDSRMVALVNGRFDGPIRFTGNGQGTVVEATFDGLVGLSSPLDIQPGRVVGTAIADVAAWPGQSSLLALRFQTNGSGVEGQLVEINPTNGTTVRTLGLPSPAHRLAVSGNGAVAWLGSLSNSIQRVDLATWAVTAELPLASSNGVRRAMALAVSPGGTEDVAVLTFPVGPTSKDPNRILAFRNGQRVELGPTLDSAGIGADVVPGRTAGEFYAVSTKVVYQLALDPERLAIRAQRSLLNEPVTSVMHPVALGDRLFLGNGGVLHADTLMDLPGYRNGGAPVNTAVLPAPESDVVLYADDSETVTKFNLTAQTLVWRRSLPQAKLPAPPADRLVRWGAQGAARLSWTDRRLILLDDALRPAELADLQITIDGPASAPLSNIPLSLQVTVTNRGPDFASEVEVRSAYGIRAIGALLPGEARTVQFTLYPTVSAVIPHSVEVVHRGNDPEPANNTAVGSTWVTASVEPGQQVIRLPSRHLIASPDGTRLFAAVGPEAAPAGIAEIDPLSGKRIRTLPVGADPQHLALTPDGRKILVRIGTNQLVRWNLDTDAIDFVHQVVNDAVVDFAGLPEPRNRLALLNRRRLSLLEGTNVVQTLALPLDDQRRIGVQGGNLWMAGNGQLRSYKINPGDLTAGLTVPISVPSGNYRFNSDDERLYFAGLVHHATSGVQARPSVEVPFVPAPGRMAYGTASGYLLRYDVSGPGPGFLPHQSAERILPLAQTGAVLDFVRWGADGFAFRTDAGFIVLARGRLLPTRSADLAVSIQAVGPTALKSPSRFRVTVTNRGPESVTGVQLTVQGQDLDALSFDPPGPSFAGVLYATLDGLAAGTSHSVEVVGIPSWISGTASIGANVVGPSIDPTPLDNSAQLVAPVVWAIADLGLQVRMPDTLAVGAEFTVPVVMTNRGPATVLRPDLTIMANPSLELVGSDRGVLETSSQGEATVQQIQPALSPGSSWSLNLRFRAKGAGVFPITFSPRAVFSDPGGADSVVRVIVQVSHANESASYPGFAMPFQDAKWSEARNQWVASDRRNLYLLEPTTLKVTGTIALPGEYDDFHLTDDGSHFWIADWSNRAVRHAFATGEADLVIEPSLDILPNRGAMAPVPGRPGTLVVFGVDPDGRPSVLAYENGTALPRQYSGDLAWAGRKLRMAAGPGGRIYVSTGSQLRELALEADGLRLVRNLDASERPADRPISVSGRLLIQDRETALDLDTLEAVNVGNLTRSNPGNVAYRVVSTDSRGPAIEAYDCVQRRALWSQPVGANVVTFASGGAAGVLLLGTDGGWLAAPDNPGVDLHLQATQDAPILGADQEFTVNLRIGTSGVWLPRNLRVAADLSPGVRAISPASDGLHWEVPVQPGERAVTFRTGSPGLQELRFRVLADDVDPAPADNEVILRFITPEPPVVLLEDLAVPDNGQPFRLRLSTAAPRPLSVQFNVQLIDAQADDLISGPLAATFETGSREARVNWIAFDTRFEPEERFRISVAPGGLPAFPDSAVITIANDDRIAIQANSVTQPEGNLGTTVAVVPFVLAESPSASVAVRFATRAGTAMPGEDFITISGMLVFAPGIRTHQVNVPIISDLRFEPSETFTVDLSDAIGLLLPASLPTVTLQNDDVPLAPVGRAALDGGGRLIIEFESEAGARYSLQSRTNLTLGSWRSEPGQVLGVGGPLTIIPAVRTVDATFFRVIAN